MSLRALAALLLLCWLLPLPARALDPDKAFHHYVRNTWSVQEGLPQISAVSIAQTSDGYLWVATQAGVTRFDGVGFTAHSPDTDPALPHPIATALALDASDALWVGTRRGMAVRRDGGFHAVPWAGAGPAPNIVSLLVADGVVWAASAAGVARVEDGELRPLPGIGATNALLQVDGVLWAGGLDGVRRWDGQRWTRTAWPGNEAPLVYGLLQVGARSGPPPRAASGCMTLRAGGPCRLPLRCRCCSFTAMATATSGAVATSAWCGYARIAASKRCPAPATTVCSTCSAPSRIARATCGWAACPTA
ncbi:hypothetical protein E4582_00480 [Luteimonas yindakuii]|uniref:Histidine kinase n=1 Tax=Luteimonas yindakuii TaxID=2565782 RepID=A0A4Z1R172_9GAMM|nr:two-component regulator propeller domain-containing protein [Luteimonas yindakuii]TKS53394.1 hypothetical protein E4582_00480 [Luteimonas yindakuii]